MNKFAILGGVALLAASATIQGQTIFGKNVVVNGDAEAGAGGDGSTPAASIPGWTRSGSADVFLYSPSDSQVTPLFASGIVPAGHGKNYFAGGQKAAGSSLTQTVDLSGGASTISGGNATFAASAYLGGYVDDKDNATVVIVFQDASGKQLSTVTLGPVAPVDRNSHSALYFRRQIGSVPAAATKATVTVNFNYVESSTNDAYADSISLVLNAPASAQSLLGSNLLVNPGADAADGYTSDLNADTSADLPGWVRTPYFTADSYQDNGGDLTTTTPGPSDRGANYFYGGNDAHDSSNPQESAYQDIDISSASSLVDGGKVSFAASGWLGGYSSQEDNCVISVQFEDWSGKVLATTQLGPVTSADRQGETSLLQRSANGAVPVGTRVIHYVVTMTRTDGTNVDGLADSLSLTLSSAGASGAPSISQNGIISAGAFGGFSSTALGSWIEIYGSNFASSPLGWSGSDFHNGIAPTSLGGVTVSVGGQPAFVDYVSSGQVNALVPSNAPTGSVQITVSNAAGTSNAYAITVLPTKPGLLAPPAFVVNGKQYVVATVDNGATFILPAGANVGAPSRPAKPGETVTMYGVGFGPVDPAINAGTLVTQLNKLTSSFQLLFGSTPGQLSYYGLAPNFTGLYQFNVVVPAVPSNDAVPVTFNLGGTPGTQTLYTAVQQ